MSEPKKRKVGEDGSALSGDLQDQLDYNEEKFIEVMISRYASPEALH